MSIPHATGNGELIERAPAKVNLTLAVTGRRADGYHLLDSLVAFARVGDELRLQPSTRLTLSVRGPTAAAAGADSDNLVIRAALALAGRVPNLAMGHFTLLKRLPVAAGIGGGSSDAAAALRLLARLNHLPLEDPRVIEAAGVTGSDVPVCLGKAARRMTGTGDILSPPIEIASMPAVLVNPRVATPTGPVFKALGLEHGHVRPTPGNALRANGLATRAGLLAGLTDASNDLEGPAISLQPAVGIALATVRSNPACRLARMSGSGATVFGLYDSCRIAAAAAKDLRRLHPLWWVVTTMIE